MCITNRWRPTLEASAAQFKCYSARGNMRESAVKHNCVIGRHCYNGHEEDLRLSDYKSIAERYANSVNSNDFFHELAGDLAAKDILDQRRGYVTIYRFCPWCGASINKRELIRVL